MIDPLIEAYCREIGSRDTMTLEELIDSHRSLRESNKVYLNQWREEVDAAVNNLLKMRINDQYVRWDELEKMTLAEIVLRIG